MTQQTVQGVPREARRPAAFPHHYEVALNGEGGHEWGVLMAPPRHPIVGGPPPEFAGKSQWWSPEHLLLASLGLCLMTTFHVFASREKLPVKRYRSRVSGELDKTPNGLAFTSLVLDVDLATEAAEADRALRLIESAKKHCIVANSLKVPVDLRVSLSG